MPKLIIFTIVTTLLFLGCTARAADHIASIEIHSSPHSLSLNGATIAYNNLTDGLRKAKRADPEIKIRIAPDKDLTYQYLAPTIMSCAQSSTANFEIVAADGTSLHVILPNFDKNASSIPSVLIRFAMTTIDKVVYVKFEGPPMEMGPGLQNRLKERRSQLDGSVVILIAPDPQTPVTKFIKAYQSVQDAGFTNIALIPSSPLANTPQNFQDGQFANNCHTRLDRRPPDTSDSSRDSAHGIKSKKCPRMDGPTAIQKPA